jgi:integrase
MTSKRAYGTGSIDPRGEGSWRLRYRVNGKAFSKTFRGTKMEAQKELRRLLHAGDKGEHVQPDKFTVKDWVEHWISIGCPGNKRRRQVGERAIERYAELLRCHVVPALGEWSLQQLDSSEIDKLYVQLDKKISARTAHHVHVVLGACLGAAARTGKIARNPMLRLEKVPSPGDADHGIALEEEELSALVKGFKNSSLFSIVAVAAFTGARRNEILALKWTGLDIEKKTVRIERAIEQTKKHGLRIKGPKKEEHKRTIAIDDNLVSTLLAERERYLRIVVGVPDSAPIDLSLVKLPNDALMFPRPPGLVKASLSLNFATRGTRRKSSAVRLPPWGSRACAFTICAARTRPIYSTRAYRLQPWRNAAGTIPRRCCAATRSAPERRTRWQPKSSVCCRKAPWANDSICPTCVQGPSKLLDCSLISTVKCLILQRWKGGRVV